MAAGLGNEKLWISPTNASESGVSAADDLSGNGNDGLVGGTASVISDTSNGGVQAFDFDGGTGDVEVYSPSLTSLGTDYSLSCWVKIASNSHADPLIQLTDPSGNYRVMYLTQHSDGNVYFGHNEGAGFNYINTSVPMAGSWVHLATTYDNASEVGTIYVNGYVAQTGSIPRPLNNGGGTFFIGSKQYGTSLGFMEGQMDDVRVYESLLTPDEVTHLASERGVEGSPQPPSSFSGLGDEYNWYCPTLSTSAPWDDISSSPTFDLTNFNSEIDLDDDGEHYKFSGSSSSYATNGARTTNRSEFSYSFWVNGKASESEVCGVVGQSSINNQRGAIVGSYQNSGQGGNGSKAHFFYQSNASSYNASQRIQSLATVFDESWHHVVVTFKGSSRVNIYVDGVLDNTKSSSIPSQVSDVWQFELGRYAGSNGFDGSLDDVRVFTRVLQAYEVEWLATERGIEGAPPPPPTGLGDELLWLTPTYSGNNSNYALVTGSGTGSCTGNVSVVADPDGGTDSVYNFNSTSASYRMTWSGGQYQTYTFSAWYRAVPQYGALCTYTASKGQMQFFLNVNFNDKPYAWNDSSYIPEPFPFDNTWHHIAYQRSGYGSGGVSKYYSDGVLVGEMVPNGSQNGSWTGSYLDIGIQARAYAGSTNLKGHLDDFRFYNRLLTDEEIAWLATEKNVLGPPQAATTGYNPFKSHTFFTRIG